MNKILYIGLLLLVSSCSWQKYNLFGSDVPYAEDVTPISVDKIEPAPVILTTSPAVIEDIVEQDVEESIEVVEEVVEITPQKELPPLEEGRPEITAVKTNEFPKIKDIPEIPETFPTQAEINQEKEELLTKTSSFAEVNGELMPFTGLDDELLIYTVNEILQRVLPSSYENKRSLLAASIKEDLSLDDLTAIELVVQDRKRNIDPLLISFYGKNLNSFKQDTIGSLLLLGLDPSLIYTTEIENDAPAKAEISLYY